MIKRLIPSIVLLIAFLFFATLFYKTICVILLFELWRKRLITKVPEKYHKWTTRGIRITLLLVLWVAMPRYRIHSGDRVRLLYMDKQENIERPPFSHWLLSTFLPEEEVLNFGMSGLRFTTPLLRYAGIGKTLINQTKKDISSGKTKNFFKPYKNLGLDNPISGVYPQVFNEMLGTHYNAFYLIEPKHYDSDKAYPLVVFCHGYLGNWQLYQGILKDIDDAIVISLSTSDLKGIFNQKDIKDIFSVYIPMLNNMGYKIKSKDIHLIGLSNGGSAVSAAMCSRYAKDFKSLTSISCNLTSLCYVPCQVNLVGGGLDNSSNRMPAEYRKLRKMGVKAQLFFNPDENHYILVNNREDIIDFLKKNMGL